jgi:hypothetical protein
MARPPITAHNVYLERPQPEILDGDMRPRDLADILARLKFGEDDLQVIKIDRAARDYLLCAVAARCGKA